MKLEEISLTKILHIHLRLEDNSQRVQIYRLCLVMRLPGLLEYPNPVGNHKIVKQPKRIFKKRCFEEDVESSQNLFPELCPPWRESVVMTVL